MNINDNNKIDSNNIIILKDILNIYLNYINCGVFKFKKKN